MVSNQKLNHEVFKIFQNPGWNDRKQLVPLNDVKSESQIMEHEVPECLVLGPLLFFTCIDDVPVTILVVYPTGPLVIALVFGPSVVSLLVVHLKVFSISVTAYYFGLRVYPRGP